MNKLFISLILFPAVFLISACSQGTPPSALSGVTVSQPQLKTSETAASPAGNEPWKTEWETLVENAGKEGKVVVICTAGSEIRDALIKAIKDKYNINAEIISARGGEVTGRLLSERRAGVYTSDVYIGGSTTIVTQLKPARVLEPLEPQLLLPEVLDGKLWWSGKLSWVDAERTALPFLAYPSPPIAINTELVKPGEIKSYPNLLSPKWKGKIEINDPTVSGSGLKWFGVVSSMILNLDYMREFAKQNPAFLRDERLLGEWLAHGKYAIWIGIKSEVVNYYKQAGAPVTYQYPAEGTYPIPWFG